MVRRVSWRRETPPGFERSVGIAQSFYLSKKFSGPVPTSPLSA